MTRAVGSQVQHPVRVGLAAMLLPAGTSHPSLLEPEGFPQEYRLLVLKPTKSQASKNKPVTLSHLKCSRVLLKIPLPSMKGLQRVFQEYILTSLTSVSHPTPMFVGKSSIGLLLVLY